MMHYRYLNWVTAIFVACLITANIIAVKLIDIGGLILPAAVIIFPVSYIVGDVLTEVYGYARARQVIWIGFTCNLIAVIAIAIASALPPADFWAPNQAAYETTLGFTPRLLAASFVAYLVGEFLNSYVLARMKVATNGRYLWARTIGSTLIGQFADSAVFITLGLLQITALPPAVQGTLPPQALLNTIVVQWLFKSVYEIVATPLTYVVVGRLKRAEGVDVFDFETDFSPFHVRVDG
ncbi:MAG TPA: queuosine precursor transporter [Anaerolineae bacterium]|nr:queuosine precursor transporter [Anaerolineae bacterium]